MCDLFEIWMASPPLQKIQKSKTTTTFWYINVRLDLKKKNPNTDFFMILFFPLLSQALHIQILTQSVLYMAPVLCLEYCLFLLWPYVLVIW